jgi:hypothetical protein
MVDPIILFAIAVALQIAGYMLAPKPAEPPPPTVEDIEAPTAEAGITMVVPFGDVLLKGPNVLWYGDKSLGRRKVKAG